MLGPRDPAGAQGARSRLRWQRSSAPVPRRPVRDRRRTAAAESAELRPQASRPSLPAPSLRETGEYGRPWMALRFTQVPPAHDIADDVGSGIGPSQAAGTLAEQEQ